MNIIFFGNLNKANTPTEFTLKVFCAKPTETLLLESTHLLEQAQILVSGFQGPTVTTLCAYPVHSLAS